MKHYSVNDIRSTPRNRTSVCLLIFVKESSLDLFAQGGGAQRTHCENGTSDVMRAANQSERSGYCWSSTAIIHGQHNGDERVQ